MYTLLSPTSSDPRSFFSSSLRSGTLKSFEVREQMRGYSTEESSGKRYIWSLRAHWGSALCFHYLCIDIMSLGPEEIAVRITGVAPHGKQEEDGTYITNNDGIPCPDSAHSKNVGGVLVASDQFLFEILQRFNRSGTQGRKKPLCSTLSLFFVVFYQFLFEILQRFNRSKTLGRKKLLCSTLSLFFVVS